jgi:hypothetical protein
METPHPTAQARAAETGVLLLAGTTCARTLRRQNGG